MFGHAWGFGMGCAMLTCDYDLSFRRVDTSIQREPHQVRWADTTERARSQDRDIEREVDIAGPETVLYSECLAWHC